MQVFLVLLKKLINRHHHRRLKLGLVLFSIMYVYATLGFWWLEKSLQPDLTLLDAAWWAMVTMTTVGYGDLYPQSDLGRFLVGYPTLIFGVAILGYGLSIIASALLEAEQKRRRGLKSTHAKQHVVIIHYKNADRIEQIVSQLQCDSSTHKLDIVLIDNRLEELPTELSERGVHFVKGEGSKLDILQKAGVPRAAYVVVLADEKDPESSDFRNLAVILSVAELNPQVRIISEAHKPEHVDFLKRAGCYSVICVEAISSQLMVQELQDPGVADIVSELTSNTVGQQIYVTDLPKSFSTFLEVRDAFLERDDVVVGIRRKQSNLISPSLRTELRPGDQAIIIASERTVLI